MVRNSDGSLAFNVAGLLREHVGATREYALQADELQLYDDTPARELTGNVRLLRINTGVLASGDVAASLWLDCSRCLTGFESRVLAEFEEEYRPRIDVMTGAPVDVSREGEDADDYFLIGLDHVLDLAEAVRQALVLHIPFNPVCRQDCAGLCTECGVNLNNGDCDCVPSGPPNPLARLEVLLSEFEDKGRDA